MAAVMLKFISLFFIIFATKRPCFTSATNLCYHKYVGESVEIKETYVYSSLWVFKEERGLFVRRQHLLKILLILAGDVELCPGPRNITCGCCTKTIRKNQAIGKCIECSEKFHLKCLKDKHVRGFEKFYCNLCYSSGDDNTDINDNNAKYILNSLSLLKNEA